MNEKILKQANTGLLNYNQYENPLYNKYIKPNNIKIETVKYIYPKIIETKIIYPQIIYEDITYYEEHDINDDGLIPTY